MDKKVLVFGHVNHGKTTISSALESVLDKHDFGIHEASEILKEGIPSYAIPFELGPRLHFNEGKQFVCKGKHQYRDFKNETSENVFTSIWVCQCGRKIND